MTARPGFARAPWIVLAALWCCVFVGGPRPARAHEFRPGVLTLREQADGSWWMTASPAFDGDRRPLADVAPRLPPDCTRQGPRVRCGPGGLTRVRYEGLRDHPVDVVVRIERSDGRTRTEVLRGDRDTVTIDEASDGWTVLGRFSILGVEHIALGADHVLFVLGLALLVGFSRRLLWTITGFTVAHSLTLGASALGWVHVRQGPVEVVIALSIVLLAVEIADPRPSWTRRAPIAVAFTFGLLHGFGFAGALREIGLPSDGALVALAGFNLGVELGQLALLAAAWIVARAIGPRLGPHARTIAAYAGGSIAVAWVLQRVVAIATA